MLFLIIVTNHFHMYLDFELGICWNILTKDLDAPYSILIHRVLDSELKKLLQSVNVYLYYIVTRWH